MLIGTQLGYASTKNEVSKTDNFLPPFEWKIGETELIVHFNTQYKIDSANCVGTLLVYDMTTKNDDDLNTAFCDSTNTYHFKYEQFGTTKVLFKNCLDKEVSFYTRPDTINEVWLDFSKDQIDIKTKGILNDLNKSHNKYKPLNLDSILTSNNDYIARLSAKEFIQHVDTIVDKEIQKVNSDNSLSNLDKYIFIKYLNEAHVEAVLNNNIYRRLALYRTNQDIKNAQASTVQELVDGISRLDLKSADAIYFATYNAYYFFIHNPRNNKVAIALLSDAQNDYGNLFRYVQTYHQWDSSIQTAPENAVDFIGSDFYSKVFRKKIEQAKQTANSSKQLLSENVSIEPTPIVSNEEIMSEIINKYKGKTLYIDFWGTSCGPCMRIIIEMEKFKQTSLAQYDNIEYIYISTISWSPVEKWNTTIANIKGHHYYLSSSQFNYILQQQFNKSGLPQILIVSKDGKKHLDTSNDVNEIINLLIQDAK